MHHANLLVGRNEWALSQIPLSERVESPDVRMYLYDRMSIADVRALIYESGLRPIGRPYRTFIVTCNSILHEAQNALLKLFEEPNTHTVFYFVIPREDILLPTLRSRLNFLAREEYPHEQKSFTQFLNASYATRLEMIAKMLDAEDGVWVTEMVHALSYYAHQKREVALIRDVLMLESYIYMNGSSKKMLLEHIALTL